MGTGKTAVAQALARKLNCQWLDMDKEIEAKENCTIEKLFEIKGEDYFRKCERDMIQELGNHDQCVISTGGGVVCDPQNIEDLKSFGICICLSASAKVIFERTRHRQDRPLLKRILNEAKQEGQDPIKKIQELLELRGPMYRKISNQIDTSEKSIYDVVNMIVGMLKENEK